MYIYERFFVAYTQFYVAYHMTFILIVQLSEFSRKRDNLKLSVVNVDLYLMLSDIVMEKRKTKNLIFRNIGVAKERSKEPNPSLEDFPKL